MKLKSLITWIIPLFVIVMLLTGCRIREKGETAGSSAGELHQREFRQTLEEVNPGLRDPASVIDLIRMTGATFQENLVNLISRPSTGLPS